MINVFPLSSDEIRITLKLYREVRINKLSSKKDAAQIGIE